MNNQLDIIKTIQNTQRRISMILGVTMGMLLILYFFTFAMLIDKGYSFLIEFEFVTAIIFVVMFFFLNKISFQITRLLFMRRSSHRQILSQLIASDMNKTPEDLQTVLANRHIQ
jgi:hypothetical protein